MNHDRRHPTTRVRINHVPALRYEGFDLSVYRIGDIYDVAAALARLLIERGYASEVAADGEGIRRAN